MKWTFLIDLTFIKSHNVHTQTIRVDADNPILSHGKKRIITIKTLAFEGAVDKWKELPDIVRSDTQTYRFHYSHSHDFKKN